ncbi:MAG: carboxypeptidase M32 [Rhodobacteraceae bacterium]|nr:carboxypeptidase M32 [Paracoccaceae bacterium]
MNRFADLMAFQRDTEALEQIAGRLGWDQETMMPEGAAAQRGDEVAAIEAVLHGRRTDPRIGDWLAGADAPDPAGRRAVELIGRTFHRNRAIPARLATEIARVTSLSQGIWAEARAKNDVALFLPVLAEVVGLIREKGEALAAAGFGGGDAYDALLEDYEPETSAAAIAAMFGRMRPRLVALREAVLGSGRSPVALTGHFPEAGQWRIARDLAGAFGYDWSRGRLDKSVHPFSSGSGNDARITTRVAEGEPFNCLYSTIHEVGHATYEQAVDQAYLLTPLGRGVSMGVHESQSRIYENQLGRSPAFTGWLYGRMRQEFGDFGLASAEEFIRAANRVHSGYIRTEADEVHYNLHIMMRFDLERRLMSGALPVADLEDAWNRRFADDFGIAVDRPSNGILQDVHWSAGLFGYFPTYALGNVYAGCLAKAMRAGIGDLDAALARGEAAPATRWLAERVQRHGALYRPAEVIERACGFAPDEAPLLDYLEAKFTALYGL